MKKQVINIICIISVGNISRTQGML